MTYLQFPSQPRSNMIRQAILSFLCLWVFTWQNQVGAESVIAPNIPHDRWDVIPFAERSGDGHYQQIYDSSLFASAISIDSVSFSLLQSREYSADVTIALGHTIKSVNSFSLPLADNVTSPLTVVYTNHDYSRQIIGGVDEFSLFFDFSSTPFTYDPSTGENLLLDISINNKNEGIGLFETGVSMIPSVPNTLTARGYEMQGFTGLNLWGARTKFTYEIPEPSSFAVLAVGCITFLAARGWHRLSAACVLP